MELCSTFSVELTGQTDAPALFILRQIFQAIRNFAKDAPDFTTTLQQEFFVRAEERHPWLADSVVLKSQLGVELLHSRDEPLLPHLERRLKSKTVKKNRCFRAVL